MGNIKDFGRDIDAGFVKLFSILDKFSQSMPCSVYIEVFRAVQTLHKELNRLHSSFVDYEPCCCSDTNDTSALIEVSNVQSYTKELSEATVIKTIISVPSELQSFIPRYNRTLETDGARISLTEPFNKKTQAHTLFKHCLRFLTGKDAHSLIQLSSTYSLLRYKCDAFEKYPFNKAKAWSALKQSFMLQRDPEARFADWVLLAEQFKVFASASVLSSLKTHKIQNFLRSESFFKRLQSSATLGRTRTRNNPRDMFFRSVCAAIGKERERSSFGHLVDSLSISNCKNFGRPLTEGTSNQAPLDTTIAYRSELSFGNRRCCISADLKCVFRGDVGRYTQSVILTSRNVDFAQDNVLLKVAIDNYPNQHNFFDREKFRQTMSLIFPEVDLDETFALFICLMAAVPMSFELTADPRKDMHKVDIHHLHLIWSAYEIVQDASN